MEKTDRIAIQKLPGNKSCIDCGEPNPQWASVKFGTLFCLQCSGEHRGLGVQTDFVRSVTLDSWTKDQTDLMKTGGNAKLDRYFEEHGVSKDTSIKEKYTSDVAMYYKKILAAAVKGEAIPPPLKMATPMLPDDSTGESEESIEDLMKDHVVTYGDVFFPALGFLSRIFVAKANLFVVALSYLLLGALNLVFPSNATLRVSTLLLACGIPLIGGGLMVYKVTRALVDHRQPAFKSARNLLLARCKSGRARRKKDAYDMYVLEKLSRQDKKYGLIFFPGALVSHTAYAPIASQLSDNGILTVVMSLEPIRFTQDFDMLTKRTLNVMYETLSVEDIQIDEWVLAGHSAGAAMAVRLAAEMKPGIGKLVLCGFGASPDMDGKSLRDAAVDVLVINGSEDKLVNRNKTLTEEAYQTMLPPSCSGKGRTRFVTIEGANHAGFGHYGPQTYPVKDGTRHITLEEQQTAFVTEIVNFLYSSADKNGKKD